MIAMIFHTRFHINLQSTSSIVAEVADLPRHRSEAVTGQKTPHDIEADFNARGRLMRAFRRVFFLIG